MPNCTCSLQVGRFVSYLTDLVMATFVITLTGLLIPYKDQVLNATLNLILLISVFAVLHLGSVWQSVWSGDGIAEMSQLRLWFVSTGLFFTYFGYKEPARCSILTILGVYYFVSLLISYTITNAAIIVNANRTIEHEANIANNQNHELKEIKVDGPEPDGQAAGISPNPLVQVALNEQSQG